MAKSQQRQHKIPPHTVIIIEKKKNRDTQEKFKLLEI